ncbi:MAG TPA: MFS transporter [Nevskiaceae bacterium]
MLCLALFAVAYTSNGVAPVLLYYTVDLRLPASALAWFFTAYAIGTVMSFVFGGPLADQRGRKAVLVPVAWIEIVSVLVLLGARWWGAPGILVGRFIQGISSGAMYAVGTVWLRELAGERHAVSAATRATASMAFGFGVGSLLSSALVQWVAAPKLLSLAVMFVLVSGALAIVLALPESLATRRTTPVHLGLPRGTRLGFACYLVPCGLLVYTFVMLAVIAFPMQIARAGFGQIYFIQGLSLMLIMAAATAATTLVGRIGLTRAGWVAALCGVVGCALGFLAVRPDGWPWVIPASIVIGAGSGMAIAAGVMMSDRLAQPRERGALLAMFYILVYAGDCVPTVLSAAWGSHAMENPTTIVGLGAAGLAVAAMLALTPRLALRQAAASRAA